jgi:hypothetical protein
MVHCYIEEIEPAKASSGDGIPSFGPVYRSIFAKTSPASVSTNLHTCWDLFVYVYVCVCVERERERER